MVSVLIPVYNGEPFLAECLDSVLAQDLGDFEIVISDDVSTDGSAALIERYAKRDNRIRWWRNPRNLGIGGNWNAALRAANGELIKFVLQDDKLLQPGALREMARLLADDESISLVSSACERIDADSHFLRRRDCFGNSAVWDGKEIILRCIDEDCNLIGEPSVVMFRRAQAARGFDERFIQWIDWEMWFHLLEQGRFAFIATPLCAFREHPNQQTQVNRRARNGEENLAVAAMYCAKPWMKDAMSARKAFRILYKRRKDYGEKSDRLVSILRKRFSAPAYAGCWLDYKIQRPFQHILKYFIKDDAAKSK